MINRKLNQGSATIEVTLIMPVILMIMVLFISMLISVLQQAKAQSELMIQWTEETCKEAEQETWGMDWIRRLGVGKGLNSAKRVYSESVSTELVNGYRIDVTQQQVIRVSATEDCLRRWQLIGNLDLQ